MNLFRFVLIRCKDCMFIAFQSAKRTVTEWQNISRAKRVTQFHTKIRNSNAALHYKFHGLFCPFNMILKFSGETISYNWIFCISMTFQRYSFALNDIYSVTLIFFPFCIKFHPMQMCIAYSRIEFKHISLHFDCISGISEVIMSHEP